MNAIECPNCKGHRVNINVMRAEGCIARCTLCSLEWVWTGETTIDHRLLLAKYMKHIAGGIDFILKEDGTYNYKFFTPEEWAELEALALIAREME